MANIFFEISLVIILATIGAYLAKLIRQPLLLAYIIVGLIIGPIGLKLVTNQEIITTLSTIGIAFLLFIVGLELNFRKIKEVGAPAVVAGIVQLAVAFILGFLLARVLGFSSLTSTYISIAMAFSSTAIVIKLLSDKKELDTLHGRLLVGIMIIQDVVAIAVLTLLATIGKFNLAFISLSMIKGIVLIAITAVFALVIFPRFFRFVASSAELLFLTSVSWCFAMAMFASYLGYSIAIGAFLAGISLASLPYNYEIISRVRPLRDFFAVMFFVSLGMQIVLGTGNVAAALVPALVLSLFILISNPAAIMLVLGLFGYGKKVSFLTGSAIAQTSEFSLIIIAQGLLQGHISQDVISLIAIITAITITLTTYIMKYNHKIYDKIQGLLSIFEFRKAQKDLAYIPEKDYDALLVGYDRTGYSILRSLERMKNKYLIIDHNPDVIKKAMRMKMPCIYGDVSDIDVLERIDLKSLKTVVSTVPDMSSSLALIKKVRSENKKADIFVTAYTIDDALKLYGAGADYVILPHFLGGERVALLLEERKDMFRVKMAHMAELRKRKSVGQEHPHLLKT